MLLWLERFTAYALDSEIDPGSGATRENVSLAMKGKILDKAVAEAGYTN